MKKKIILPRHTRVDQPSRMRVTERDVQVLLAVHDYRLLRRDQIQLLLFPSRNTANERLKRLYQHGFLERRWLPVEYGHGMSQAIYLLGQLGADLVAERRGVAKSTMNWKAAHNQVGALFLEHTLMINDVRVTFTIAAREGGYRVDKWIGETELKAVGDYVHITTSSGGTRKIAVIPDGYLALNLGHRRAHFLLEIDRGTVSNRRWRERIQAYLKYVESGKYAERYRTRSLRVLTVTTGQRRMANLKRTTEATGGKALFWFTTLEKVTPASIFRQPIWAVAGQEDIVSLIE